MPNLYVVGDSFSFIPNENCGEENVWSISLSKKIKYQLYDYSLVGCAQDYIFQQIANIKHTITSDDRLIVVLTDPSRFWFFEDIAHLTNIQIVDFESVLPNKERYAATQYYFKYIQRLSLDTQLMNHRLGWLNNIVTVYNWQKPIIILGFPQAIDYDDYTNLIFSNGDLSSVSKSELTSSKVDLYGIDPRFNHLCFRNHTVLVDKLDNTLTNNDPLDLTGGFHEKFLSSKLIADDDFISKELNANAVKKHLNTKLSFLQRTFRAKP